MDDLCHLNRVQARSVRIDSVNRRVSLNSFFSERSQRRIDERSGVPLLLVREPRPGQAALSLLARAPEQDL